MLFYLIFKFILFEIWQDEGQRISHEGLKRRGSDVTASSWVRYLFKSGEVIDMGLIRTQCYAVLV
jgi:hypothetical protein